MDEFKFYIQKMQKLLKNDKIQPLLTRRKSQKLVQQFSLSVEEKRDKIDKIKSLIKENKKELNSKEIANQYLQQLNKDENHNKAESIMKEDINHQEESFKKRLEEKRLLRGNSQPHMKLKVKFIKNKIKYFYYFRPNLTTTRRKFYQSTQIQIYQKKIYKQMP
jgi:hypothetical protein